MSRKIVTVEMDADLAPLLLEYAAYLDEMKHLAKTAPDGAVLAVCEQAVIQRGREHQRRALTQALQARIDDAEKKGRRSGVAPAEKSAKIADPHGVKSSP
jgi:hypothetical protein